MRDAAALRAFVEAQPEMMATLEAVAALKLPDCWIGAGFLRNAAWDALHGRPWAAGEGDIDVIYFDPTDATLEAEQAVERALATAAQRRWSVRNQARMHLRNGDAPYRDTEDAMAHWLETCTAVAARLMEGRVALLAPFGLDDLFGLIVRQSPAGLRKPADFAARVTGKAWLRQWPKLRLAAASPTF